MDRAAIEAAIRKIAGENGGNSLTKSRFKFKSGISEYQIYKHYDTWNEAVENAGLTPNRVRRIDDIKLLREMKNVFVDCNGVCTQVKFGKLCRYSASVYKSHFGRWPEVLLAFKAWLHDSGEDFPFLNQLPDAASFHQVEESAYPRRRRVGAASRDSPRMMTYGSFLNFRGLEHAPVNEQGVVFLFGMVCFELGFVVESVRIGYPDCEAKRRMSPSRDEWERVRIEFEYCSSNFRDHGHDPSGCDVIVCWEHDWPECPLEVIELKTAIQSIAR